MDEVEVVIPVQGRRAKPDWNVSGKSDFADYERMFKGIIENLSNKDGFEIGGNLVVRFIPKHEPRLERLISSDTAFLFHKLKEVYPHKFIASGNENGYKLYALGSYARQVHTH